MINQIYADCMVRVQRRLSNVDDVLAGALSPDNADLLVETVFLQFRKALEELAFVSLSANLALYSKVHSKFAQHWRAKEVLAEIEKLNPGFYPVPLENKGLSGDGVFQFEVLADGFLARDQFLLLYDCSSEILHTRNPYKPGTSTIAVHFTGPEWLARFRRLLEWHQAQLVDGSVLICNVPRVGGVHLSSAIPSPSATT